MAVTESSITVKSSGAAKGEGAKSFVITPKTKQTAKIEKNELVTVYYHRDSNIAERIDMVAALEGLLLPGNLADPPAPASCGSVPLDALRVYLGGSLGWSSSPELTAISYEDTPIIRIRRTAAGIAVEGRLFEPSGRPGAAIVDNRLYLNPDGYFRVKRPNRYTLDLYDKQNQAIFEIQFLNSHSVSVSGNFVLPHLQPLVVSQNAIVAPGDNLMIGNCIGNFNIMLKIGQNGSLAMGARQ